MKAMAVNWLAILLLAGDAGMAHAEGYSPDSVSIEYGTGNRTRIERAALQWDWQQDWYDSNDTHLNGYWDLSVAHWQERAWEGVSGRDHSDTDIGLTPVFRFEGSDRLGWYGEAGIGANVLTPIYDNNHRHFSTAFQFGDHLGFGFQRQKWSVGIKLQHYSNGAIKHPNPGANFAVLGLVLRF